VSVGNALISMYAKCGALADVDGLFDFMTEKGIVDLVTWNSVIAAVTYSLFFAFPDNRYRVLWVDGNCVCSH